MTWLDIGLIVILAAFTVTGLMQGMLRQLIGLISLLAALLLAGRYFVSLAHWLTFVPALRPMALPAAYAILLVGVWSLMNLVGVVLYDEKGRENDDHWFDDVAGGILGLLSGVFLLVALIVGAQILGLETANIVAQSRIMVWMVHLIEVILGLPLWIKEDSNLPVAYVNSLLTNQRA